MTNSHKLIFILVIGFIFRILGIDWGLSQKPYFHAYPVFQDESIVIKSLSNMNLRKLDFNPKEIMAYGRGTFIIYASGLWYGLGSVFGAVKIHPDYDWYKKNPGHLRGLYIFGRYLMVIFAMLSIYLTYIDADGSHIPEDIPKLIEPIINDESDLTVASRIKGGSDEFYINLDSFIRQVGSDLVTLIINTKFKQHLTDVENGFRAIKHEVFNNLNLTSNRFEIEQEMIIKALKKGYRIKEIPSHEYERKAGVSKLQTSEGWRFVLELIKDII